MRSLDDMKDDFELHLRRGNLTWEGSRMMLPEHKAAIREQNKKENRIEKHVLDPDELQLLGYVAMDALSHTHLVSINYWHDWTYVEVTGVISSISKDQKFIKLEQENDETTYIDVNCLREIRII